MQNRISLKGPMFSKCNLSYDSIKDTFNVLNKSMIQLDQSLFGRLGGRDRPLSPPLPLFFLERAAWAFKMMQKNVMKLWNNIKQSLNSSFPLQLLDL